MPKARRTSYNLAFKLKIVAEAEAVEENNSEIAREYGISESMVRRWRKDQANLFNSEIKLSVKRQIWDASTEQRSQGKFSVEHWFCILKQQKHDREINQSADCRVNVSWMCDSQNYRSIMWQHCVWKILIGQFSQASKQIHHIIKLLSFWSFSNVLTSFRIGIAVSGLMLRQKAKEFSKDRCEDPEFKASLGWYQKWKRRHSVSLRIKNNTHSASPRRFGAANSQVPSICNHIPSASRLFPIKNI